MAHRTYAPLFLPGTTPWGTASASAMAPWPGSFWTNSRARQAHEIARRARVDASQVEATRAGRTGFVSRATCSPPRGTASGCVTSNRGTACVDAAAQHMTGKNHRDVTAGVALGRETGCRWPSVVPAVRRESPRGKLETPTAGADSRGRAKAGRRPGSGGRFYARRSSVTIAGAVPAGFPALHEGSVSLSRTPTRKQEVTSHGQVFWRM